MADALVSVHGTCLQCGALFERTYKTARYKPFLCSNACKVARFVALNPGKVADQRKKERAKHIPKACRCGEVRMLGKRTCSQCGDADFEARKAKARVLARNTAAAKAKPEAKCQECGVCFIAPYGSKRRVYCSLVCRKRSSGRIRRKSERARLRLVSVEPVNPTKVFERDGWRCQCCRKPTPRDKRGTYHPRAPELDHIIPLSKGGEHSYRNTQLLCRACNAAKSDSDQGQQLRLFG